jgi:hypothetical protein
MRRFSLQKQARFSISLLPLTTIDESVVKTHNVDMHCILRIFAGAHVPNLTD